MGRGKRKKRRRSSQTPSDPSQAGAVDHHLAQAQRRLEVHDFRGALKGFERAGQAGVLDDQIHARAAFAAKGVLESADPDSGQWRAVAKRALEKGMLTQRALWQVELRERWRRGHPVDGTLQALPPSDSRAIELTLSLSAADPNTLDPAEVRRRAKTLVRDDPRLQAWFPDLMRAYAEFRRDGRAKLRAALRRQVHDEPLLGLAALLLARSRRLIQRLPGTDRSPRGELIDAVARITLARDPRAEAHRAEQRFAGSPLLEQYRGVLARRGVPDETEGLEQAIASRDIERIEDALECSPLALLSPGSAQTCLARSLVELNHALERGEVALAETYALVGRQLVEYGEPQLSSKRRRKLFDELNERLFRFRVVRGELPSRSAAASLLLDDTLDALEEAAGPRDVTDQALALARIVLDSIPSEEALELDSEDHERLVVAQATVLALGEEELDVEVAKHVVADDAVSDALVRRIIRRCDPPTAVTLRLARTACDGAGRLAAEAARALRNGEDADRIVFSMLDCLKVALVGVTAKRTLLSELPSWLSADMPEDDLPSEHALGSFLQQLYRRVADCSIEALLALVRMLRVCGYERSYREALDSLRPALAGKLGVPPAPESTLADLLARLGASVIAGDSDMQERALRSVRRHISRLSSGRERAEGLWEAIGALEAIRDDTSSDFVETLRTWQGAFYRGALSLGRETCWDPLLHDAVVAETGRFAAAHAFVGRQLMAPEEEPAVLAMRAWKDLGDPGRRPGAVKMLRIARKLARRRPLKHLEAFLEKARRVIDELEAVGDLMSLSLPESEPDNPGGGARSRRRAGRPWA